MTHPNPYFRIWTSPRMKQSLTSIEGMPIGSFEAMEAWLSTQPDGVIQFRLPPSKTWFMCCKEAQPFRITAGKVFCSHPSYRSKQGLDPADFSGFFAFEAWQRAQKSAAFYYGFSSALGGHITSQKD